MAINIQATINAATKNKTAPQSTLPANSSLLTAPRKSPSPYKISIPNSVPSTALSADLTPDDVLRSRNSRAAEIDATKVKTNGLSDLLGRAQAPIEPSPLSNPDEFLARTFRNDRELTTAEKSRDSLLDRALDTTKDFFSGRDRQIKSAQREYGVADKQELLSETRNQIAERRVRLRKDLRALDTSAEFRGMARPFADDQRRKITSDATTELADLAIIETAQLGNLEEARGLANDLVDEQYNAYTGEIAEIQAELDRLEPTLTAEEKERSFMIQAALDERVRLIEDRKADAKEVRDIMIEAASNGADAATLGSIKNATSPEQAIIAAGDWIGLVDRLAAYDNMGGDDAGGDVTFSEDGQRIITLTDGSTISSADIDLEDPAQIDALPVSPLTKSVITGIAKSKDLTPTQKGAVAEELYKIGFNPNNYIGKKLSSLVETWQSVPDASRGVVEGWKFWERYTNPDVAAFESQRTLLTREIARLFDVGVLSDQDVASYNNAMPSRLDSSLDVVLKKVAGISNAATGSNTQNVGKRGTLADGRAYIVAADGDTLLDPKTGKPLE